MWRGFLAVLAAGALTLPLAAQAEPPRRALVIGNSDYSALRPLPNTVNDARDMGSALTKLGFEVTQARDAKLDAFERDLAAFAATIKPGDTALVYFAGHGVTGRTAADPARTDSFLLPVDVALATPGDVPKRSRGLSAVLDALNRAGAGMRLVVIDACRDNPFASVWPAAEPGAGGGLAQPSTASLHGALIAFATSPGEFAIENSTGRNGLFTQELLKRLATPGAALSVVLADVSAAVEFASKGEQIPFFVAGDASAAAMILKAGPAPAGNADPLTMDLRLQREALQCGLPACLESAAADIRDVTLRTALLTQAKGLRAGSRGAAVSVAAAALPPVDPLLPPAAAAVITRESGRSNGAVGIAKRFINGADGFPRDAAEALKWYRAAAEAGSGEAAFETASAYHDGLAGVPKNRVEAYRWIVRASRLKYGPAFTLGGRYHLEGWGGQTKNDIAAARWFEQGHALGDAASALELGRLSTDDADRQAALYRTASDKGLPEAMFRTAYNLDSGVLGSNPEARRLYKAAGDGGFLWGYRNLGIGHWRGAGPAHDIAEAIRWFSLAAERGDNDSMWMLARVYSEADSGQLADCAKAQLWMRRAAVAGSWEAIEVAQHGSMRCGTVPSPSR